MGSFCEGSNTSIKRVYSQEFKDRQSDHERLDADEIWKHIKTSADEDVLVRSAFRWLIDGKVIPNAFECYDLEYVCSERNWNIVCCYGDHLAIIKEKQ